MENRRRWPRMEIALMVVFRFGRHEDLARHSTIKDISLGGVFIVTEQVRPKGTRVRLQLEFRDGSVISAEGRIVRVVPTEIAVMKGVQPGIGVEFTQIDEESRRVLEEALGSGSSVAT